MEEGSILVSCTVVLGEILTDHNQRPKEFPKSSAYEEDSDEEESTVGKMPPSSDSEDE